MPFLVWRKLQSAKKLARLHLKTQLQSGTCTSKVTSCQGLLAASSPSSLYLGTWSRIRKSQSMFTTDAGDVENVIMKLQLLAMMHGLSRELFSVGVEL